MVIIEGNGFRKNGQHFGDVTERSYKILNIRKNETLGFPPGGLGSGCLFAPAD